ncbi:MAG: hypothetical protein IJA75_03135 [Oscillospiraceae bacterium]|nr:hypothetical protein [Oscillospiraceae bacterium]
MPKKSEKTKEQRIKAERNRLLKIYKGLPKAKLALAEGLIESAAFKRVEMQDLQAFLEKNGWSEMFSQGNQKPYARSRPEGDKYVSLDTAYQKAIKQLDAMLPKEETLPRAEADDGFDDFVSGRDDP